MPAKVGIIGAGVCGLCCAKQLLEQTNCQVTIFEEKAWIGGLWNYNPNPNAKNALYESLRTNLPQQLMEFPDFTIETHNHTAYSNCNLFPYHKQVLSYLKQYTSQFNLIPYIKFHHKVISLKQQTNPTKQNKEKTFHVTVNDTKNNRIQNYTFDAIVVCNGHYNECYIPNIDKCNQFNGIIMHSRYYRRPDQVFDQSDRLNVTQNCDKVSKEMRKNIVIIGNKSSGFDLSKDLYLYLNKNKLDKKYQIFHISRSVLDEKSINSRLFFKHRNSWMKSGNYHFVQGLIFDSLTNENKAVFKYINSSNIEIPIVNNGLNCNEYDCNDIKFDDKNKIVCISCDLCLFCTGYYFDFPFLLNESENDKDDELNNYFNKKTYVPMLYDGIFFALNPMLSFVGIQKKLAPFVVVYYQCLYVARVVSGMKKLTKKQDICHNNINYGFFQNTKDHLLGDAQFDYIEQICEKLGVEKPKYLDVWRNAYSNKFVLRYQNIYNVSITSKL